jgi:adenine phosphoribosyltransferase
MLNYPPGITDSKILENLKKRIRTIPNWPKKGVLFRDITTLLKDAVAFEMTMDLLEKRYSAMDFDLIACIEARGFVIGAALAARINKGIVLIRKSGKLPGKTISEEYDLEYGKNTIELPEDAIVPGNKILLVDDLLATGGTAYAGCKLIEKKGGKIVECCFIIDLTSLGGKQKLASAGYGVFNLIEFNGK